MWKRICVFLLLSVLTSISYSNGQPSIQLSKTWTAEKEPLIGDISGIAVNENGSVFVADDENYTILKYDSTGAFVTQAGRRGAGPGEFSRVSDIAVFDDTVYVADRKNRRVSLFTTDLEYVRQIRYPQKAPAFTDIAFDDRGRLYGAGTGMKEGKWLLYDALRADSSRFIELAHVHGDIMYDKFKISTSRANDLLAIGYAFKDTLELFRSPQNRIGEFPIIRDHSHESSPPVAKDLSKLKSRPPPGTDDFITWHLSTSQKGHIWVLAGTYANPPRQVLYVYNTDGDRVSKTTAPSPISNFIIYGRALYAAVKEGTRLRKYEISYQ